MVLSILSTSWRSVVEQADQGGAYRAFVIELNRRLAAAGSKARFEAGMNPFVYWAGVALLAAVIVALIGLTVRVVQAGGGLAALLIIGFVLLFFWQGGTMFYRNRPGIYRPDAPPPAVLPRAPA